MGHARAFIPLAGVIWALCTHNANPAAKGGVVSLSAPMPPMDRKRADARLPYERNGWQGWISSALSTHDARLIKTLPRPVVADTRAEWKD
jgi:hypothetical protein